MKIGIFEKTQIGSVIPRATLSAPLYVNFNKKLNQISDMVIVESMDDFPAPVEGVITLESKLYCINASVTTSDRFAFPSGSIVRLEGSDAFRVGITYTGVGAMFTGTDFASFSTAQTEFSFPNGTLFDIQPETPQTGRIFLLNTFSIDGSGLGIVKNISSFALTLTAFFDIGTGLTLDSVGSILFTNTRAALWKNQSISMFTFQGIINEVVFSSALFSPGSNEKALDIKSTATIGSGNVTGCPFNHADRIFASGSKDQTDPHWSYAANSNLPDSTVFGDMAQNNVTETTTIATQGVAVSANMTWEDGVERMVLEHVVTYSGQTTDFTVGQVLTGTNSGAFGTIISIDDSGATGTLILQNVDGLFETNEPITDPLGGDGDLDKISGHLKYTGLEEVLVKVTSNTTLKPVTGQNIKLATYIAKNGVIIERSEGKNVISNVAGGERSIYGQAAISLVTDDYLEVFVENEATTSDIIITDVSFVVTKS